MRQLLQCLIQSLDQQVGVIGAEYQLWPDLEKIGFRPGGPAVPQFLGANLTAALDGFEEAR